MFPKEIKIYLEGSHEWASATPLSMLAICSHQSSSMEAPGEHFHFHLTQVWVPTAWFAHDEKSSRFYNRLREISSLLQTSLGYQLKGFGAKEDDRLQ